MPCRKYTFKEIEKLGMTVDIRERQKYGARPKSKTGGSANKVIYGVNFEI